MSVTTLGREMVRKVLPDKYKGWADKTLDKKTIVALTTQMAKEDPDAYVQVLQGLNNVGERVVSIYGRDAALSFTDAVPSKATMELNRKLRQLVDQVLDDPKLSEEQKEERIKEIGYKYTQKVQDAVFADQDERHTALASQINSGSRGNKTQLMQLMFGNMMMKDALGRDIPYLHMDPYVFGTSPFGYWVSSSSGRKGFYDVQAATGQAGYLGKQVTAVTHDVVIEKDDCGTKDTGIPFKAADPANIGRVLLRPFHKHPAGSIVTPDMVSEADDDEEMLLRSPVTCKCRHGVCAKCNGLDENGRFPGVGSYVSLNSARTFVEKITQAGISCLYEDTLVRMADGSAKRIADIEAGDTVLGADMFGEFEPAKVTAVMNNGVQPVYRTLLENGAELVSTERHKVLKELMVDYVEEAVGKHPEGEYWPVMIEPKEFPEEAIVVEHEYVGMAQVNDIEVDNDDHLFVLANGLIVSNSKHQGGVGGKKVVDPDGEDQPTGFKAIERMFMAPDNFPGGAVVAPEDGVVSAIRPAPQGGNYITVGLKTLYCSPDRTFNVRVGDKVSAGDVLTNGVPNPAQIVQYKGLGAGRRYYINKLNDVFAKAGFGVDRNNLESFTRAMINKVQITADDGYRGYLPGDIVSYSEIASDWTPRDDSVTMKASKATGKYLEQPVLHYSIGTRVTPDVSKTLDKYGFNDVLVNDNPPPFTSEFMRPAAALQNDEHWLPRLAGERLKDSLFDAARRGLTDPYDSTSYVDRIVTAPFK